MTASRITNSHQTLHKQNLNKLESIIQEKAVLEAKIETLRAKKMSHTQHGTGQKVPIKSIHALEQTLDSCNRKMDPFKSPFREKPLTSAQTEEKMKKNLLKAQKGTTISLKDLFPSHNQTSISSVNVTATASKSFKEGQESYPFFFEAFPGKIAAGVLSGDEKAGFLAKALFLKEFPLALRQTDQHEHLAFEITIDKIQQAILKNCKPKRTLCTAVFSLVDYERNSIFTATIGDCLSRCYRPKDQETVIIHLSLLKDWTSSSDAKRAFPFIENQQSSKNLNKYTAVTKTYKNDGEIIYHWGIRPEKRLCRYLRDPETNKYFNVSRSFGYEHIPIIAKPKITKATLKPGDVVVLSNYELGRLPELSIIDEIKKEDKNPLNKRLVIKAVEHCNDLGSIPVVAIKVD
ncbi:MAG: hypothetical protein JSS09_05890 [Verrucomicrobia bacterium]|nr:hypothetical protein [Verrucomicrobiota bacterium]